MSETWAQHRRVLWEELEALIRERQELDIVVRYLRGRIAMIVRAVTAEAVGL